MITKIVGYQSGQQFFPLIDDARKHAIADLLAETEVHQASPLGDLRNIASAILECGDEAVNILTLCASSRPRARKANGAKRKTKKPAAQPENP